MPRPSRTEALDIHFDEDVPWQSMIDAGAPDTPADYPIRRAHPGVWGASSGDRKVVLVTFDTSLTSKEVDVWALGQTLCPLFAQEILRVGQEHPLLSSALGIDCLGLAALRPFDFESRRVVCTLWWYLDQQKESYRLAHLTNCQGSWNKDYWFAFTPTL